MKITRRSVSLFLVFTILVFCVACSGTVDADKNVESKTSEQSTESAKPDAPAEYDGIFRVGYARVDITPDTPIELNTGDALTRVKEHLFATCVAVFDGETTLLLYSLDVKNISGSYIDYMKMRVKTMTGVPASNIIINPMHNHSAPDPSERSAALSKWTARLLGQMASIGKEAIADLSDAQMYMGKAKTTNLAFVRRYIHEDGSFSSIHYRGASTSPIVAHESEADDTAQIIRMVREDKKDVILTNWQCHVAHAIAVMPATVSGDYVYYLREGIESADGDALVMFFLGAAGNINTSVKINERNIAFGNYKKVGEKLADAIVSELDSLERISAGKIKIKTVVYNAEYRTESAERIAQAKEIAASGGVGSTQYNAMLDKYGFKSVYEVSRVISLEALAGKTSPLELTVVGFGDLAFSTIPYEMFDTNGMELKEASPYKMTFILTCTGKGEAGYVPSALAVGNGGYEVYQSLVKYGTAEAVVETVLRELNKLYEK